MARLENRDAGTSLRSVWLQKIELSPISVKFWLQLFYEAPEVEAFQPLEAMEGGEERGSCLTT